MHKIYEKQQPRPVVAMSMTSAFNETVTMDLKVWNNGLYFLVLVDIATIFFRAVVISDKKPDAILREHFLNCISLFGAPSKMLSDNGGRFSNQTMRELSDGFEIHLVCTQSLWSNSVCEHLNGFLSVSVIKFIGDTGCLIHVALSWAVAARNALHSCHG